MPIKVLLSLVSAVFGVERPLELKAYQVCLCASTMYASSRPRLLLQHEAITSPRFARRMYEMLNIMTIVRQS